MGLSEKHNFSKAWFTTAAMDNEVYLFCPRELRLIVHITGDGDIFQLQMIDLKIFEQVIQKRKEINRSKPQ